MSASTNSSPIWSKGPFALHRRHLEITSKQAATRQQLKDAAKTILTMRDSGAWGIGDLIVYAKSLGAEQPIDEVIENLVRDPQMARKCFYVANAVGVDDREHDLWWNFYFSVYTFPAEVRNRLLALCEENHWTLDEFKKHLRDLRHRVRQDTQSFPVGQYGLLYADPAWQYEEGTAHPDRQIENQYPTMDIDAIRTFADGEGRTVEDLAAKNCVLYLWTPAPKMEEALSVGAAWGFEYRTNAVWVKDLTGPGYWFRSRHELLLVFVKGDAIVPSEDLRRDSVFQYPRKEHSAKPPEVYEMLEAQFPSTPKIELFARSTRDGWESFGNQLPETAAGADMPAELPTDDDGVPDTDAEQRARDEAGGKKKRSHHKKADVPADAPRHVSKRKDKDATAATA